MIDSSTDTGTGAQVARYYADAAQAEGPGQRSWITRGANFVVVLSQVQPGARLERIEQPDEYMVLLPDAGATVTAGADSVAASAGSLTIVPPGHSEIVAQGTGYVVRVFSNLNSDLLASAANSAIYGLGAVRGVAPLVPWPDPVGGFRLRNYELGSHAREGTNTRIFRSTNLMINVLLPREQPRDVRKLSPHAHADFEQGSLALAGRWTHHLRTPWTPDLTAWRDDEHLELESPSLLVIPPTVVHTSHNVNDGNAWLIDIFSPPRLDFSTKGVVLNADEYPMPEAAAHGGAQ